MNDLRFEFGEDGLYRPAIVICAGVRLPAAAAAFGGGYQREDLGNLDRIAISTGRLG